MIKKYQVVAILTIFMMLSIAFAQTSNQTQIKTGLAIQNADSRLAYITHNNEPLLAFGCHFEHMLFDDYDYKKWTEWAINHGMNHCRTRLYHAYYRKYSPFVKTQDGRYDLTKWDENFWQRTREILSYMQDKGIIVHLLIFPQGSGGYWWQGDGYYATENNVHPETSFIRPNKSTAGFWRTWSQGERRLYEIQTAILWKLIEETAEYDNIYYDICHEPFIHAMKPDAQQDLKEFLSETTRRFVKQYQELQPNKIPLMGLDTDFTPPGETRDWIYSHNRFNIMIQGKNHDPFYVTAQESIELIKIFKKPFCPQESLDLPGIVHVHDIKHKNGLTYFEPRLRHHLRKYVWRWIMARSQLIDIYQKSLSKKVTERERYEPNSHNEFEKDALIIREFWDQLRDYPNLDFQGSVSNGPGQVQMVLSSEREAIVYMSSTPGIEGIRFCAQDIQIQGLGLADGDYHVEIWKPSSPGGIVQRNRTNLKNGKTSFKLPDFVDDLVVHILNK